MIAWWGWRNGAYFDLVFIPGAMVLVALAIVLALFAPWPGRLNGAARVSLFALIALAGWTLLSALWSPAPAIAISDGQRVFAYAVAFGLGTWLCLLLGRRMLLSLAPLAGAGAVVAVATLIALWVGDNVAEFLDGDAALRYPLGYRNAEAAFFGIAIWPMLVLAAARDLDWRVRGALIGAATLSIELGVLSQSWAALLAFVVGAAVLVAIHPARLRMLGYVALAALPAALALPWLLDVAQADAGDSAASLDPLHTACAAMAATSIGACLLGALAARADPALSPRGRRIVGGALLAAIAAAVVAGALGLARADGGAAGLYDEHIDQITADTGDPGEEGGDLELGSRSQREDLWGVALDEFEADPILGGGGGAFRSAYVLERQASDVEPEDPHSVQMLLASELGIPGLALFAAFLIGAALAAVRARRLGPSAGALAAGALAAGAFWLLVASVDWFWNYPAITLPVVFALGAAAAPGLLRPAGAPRRSRRAPLVLTGLIAIASLVPFYLSDRYTRDALRSWPDDLPEAHSNLDRAADLNPLSGWPLAAEAVVAEAADEPQRALAALSEAQSRTPTEWTLYYLEARVLEQIDPAGARRALDRARALNPLGPEIRELEQGFDQP